MAFNAAKEPLPPIVPSNVVLHQAGVEKKACPLCAKQVPIVLLARVVSLTRMLLLTLAHASKYAGASGGMRKDIARANI